MPVRSGTEMSIQGEVIRAFSKVKGIVRNGLGTVAPTSANGSYNLRQKDIAVKARVSD